MKSKISFFRTKVPWRKIVFIFNLIVMNNFSHSQGQLPECTSTVPFFNIDLSASPDATFTTPQIIRKTGCCSVNNEYVSFYVKLHPDVAQFELIVAPGYADPGGAGNYNIISGEILFTSNPITIMIGMEKTIQEKKFQMAPTSHYLQFLVKKRLPLKDTWI